MSTDLTRHRLDLGAYQFGESEMQGLRATHIGYANVGSTRVAIAKEISRPASLRTRRHGNLADFSRLSSPPFVSLSLRRSRVTSVFARRETPSDSRSEARNIRQRRVNQQYNLFILRDPIPTRVYVAKYRYKTSPRYD